MKDQIYRSDDAATAAQPPASIAPFRFNETVAHVFEDMIGRSVPGYSLMLELIALTSNRYGGSPEDQSLCYDLGCSLGASAMAIAHGLQQGPGHSLSSNLSKTRIVGIDNSSAMLKRCRSNVDRDPAAAQCVSLLESDICDVEYEACNLVVSNFTLQFVALEKRAALVAVLHRALKPGGAFFLAEKIRHEPQSSNNLMIDLHERFKKSRGYSDMEIAGKRAALEAVLIPETADTHVQRLSQAGFSEVIECFRCLNFCAFIAIK